MRCLDVAEPEINLATARQKVKVKQGIEQPIAKKIVAAIDGREAQGRDADQRRHAPRHRHEEGRPAASRSALLRKTELDVSLQFDNFRRPTRRALVYLAVVVVAIAHADEEPKTSYDTQVVLESVSVASPYKLSTDARAGAIRYRFALADGAKRHWPETGEQHVAADDDGVATVTICTDCGREPAPSAEALKAYPRPQRVGQAATMYASAISRAAPAADASMHAWITSCSRCSGV